MLDSVIGNYLETLKEREFDAPFLCLLRALGFTDIHFLHGTFEFGKDFIARRQDPEGLTQYAFQSKAGDIDATTWRVVRGQCDELRTNILGHPNFDKDLPRKAVLVLTGRLVGAAATLSQDYNNFLKSKGETLLVPWDRETLIRFYVSEPSRLSSFRARSPSFLLAIARIQKRDWNRRGLQEFSKDWLQVAGEDAAYGILLEASCLAHELEQTNRLDLTIETVLHALRALWFHSYGQPPIPRWAKESIASCKDMFRYYAEQLNAKLKGELLAEKGLMIGSVVSVTALYTYPIRCMMTIEFMGLLGLLYQESGKTEDAKRVTESVAALIRNNAGCAHPVSDDFAVSIIAPAVLLHINGLASEVEPWLKRVVVWLCDRYVDNKYGLAAPGSTPQEELQTLLGYPYSFIDSNARRASYLASVLLDLLAVLRIGKLYELAVNDFKAVDAVPVQIAPKDTKESLIQSKLGGDLLMNPDYSEKWEPKDGWKVAPHHLSAPADFFPMREGSPWSMIAIASVMRDRHYLSAIKAMLA